METAYYVVATNNLLMVSSIVAIIGIISSKLSEKVNVPDVVLFLIAGIIIGPACLKLVDIEKFVVENQLILTFGSAFILYLGGKEISFKVLKDVKITVLLLSTIGVIISAIIVQQIIGLVFDVDMLTALLIGSIIASTDPATLVPIFSQVKIKNKVKQAVISESAFNDATGAILTLSIFSIITSGNFSTTQTIYDFIIMIAVGLMIGAIIGILLLKLVSDKPYGIFSDYAPIVSIISVVLAYELSTKLGGSGYMSCFIVGIITGNKKNFRIWLKDKDYNADLNVTETLGTVCRMAIFILLGTQVDLEILGQYFVPSLITVLGLIFVARPICVLVCTIFDKKANWDKNEVIFMMWVRETGVIPAALSGIIVSMKIPGYNIISSVVFMTILITLILQGSTTKLLAKKLNLLEEDVK